MREIRTIGPAVPPAILAGGGDFDLVAGLFGAIVVRAGAVIMDIYRGRPEVRTKADASPVCDADEKAEQLIQAELAVGLPNVPILAEEAASRGITPELDGRFILVDPVDGTKEFLRRNGEFTVNIALIDHGTPRAGAVYAPALERLWVAGERAFVCSIAPGADFKTAPLVPIHSRPAPTSGLVVMASRSHSDSKTEEFLSGFSIADRRNAGSSLKFCALAEGQADLYPRFGPTMEWDTAAGDAVLRAAGGSVLGLDATALTYGRRETGFRNTAFVAWGDAVAGARLMRERLPA